MIAVFDKLCRKKYIVKQGYGRENSEYFFTTSNGCWFEKSWNEEIKRTG